MQMHRGLTQEKWSQLTLFEQLGNVGSEVGRALKWYAEDNEDMWEPALYRALEPFDLTIADSRWRWRLKEICRAREVVVDYFCGDNQYGADPKSLENYFMQFALTARNNGRN